MQLFAFLTAVSRQSVPTECAVKCIRALVNLRECRACGAPLRPAALARMPTPLRRNRAEHYSTLPPRVSFYPRLMTLLDAEVATWYASARQGQASERAEEAALGPALRPPSAYSMLMLPSAEHVARGIGAERISVSARGWRVTVAQLGLCDTPPPLWFSGPCHRAR